MTTILLVDDDESFLEICKTILEKIHQISVIPTTNTADVLNLLQEYPIEAIVSDYQMIGISGLQLLKLVRKDPSFHSIPFIIFTGRSREEVVIEAINAGADFYLQKGGDPASQFAELAGKINQSIARKRAEEASKKEVIFRNLLKSAPVFIFRMRISDESFEYVSEGAELLTGFSPERIIETPAVIKESIHPEYKTNYINGIQKIKEGISIPEFEYPFCHPSGKTLWFHQDNFLVLDEMGNPSFIEGMVSDITRSKEIESEIILFRNLVQILSSDHPVPSMISDSSGRIISINKEASELFDLEISHNPDMVVSDLFEEGDTWIKTFSHNILRKKVKIKAKSGSIQIETIIVNSTNELGEPYYSIYLMRN